LYIEYVSIIIPPMLHILICHHLSSFRAGAVGVYQAAVPKGSVWPHSKH